MKREPLKIEDLLDHMGTQEHPGDPAHRYELRRKLLCSRFFDGCDRQGRWDRMLTYTAPLLAGGMMVGVMVVFATSWPQGAVNSTGTISSHTMPSASIELADITVDVGDFVSDVHAPVVRLADFNTNPQVRFLPLAHRQIVRTR